MMINHLPILGTAFGLLLMLGGYATGSRDIKKAALATLVFTGISAGATFLTGEPAEEAVKNWVYVSEHYIEHHEEAALIAMIASVTLGILSAAVLIRSKGADVRKACGMAVILGAVVVSGLMAWTANYGGQINHPEIRAEDAGHEGHEGYGEHGDHEH
jgi:uncharacterized membrane protein